MNINQKEIMDRYDVLADMWMDAYKIIHDTKAMGCSRLDEIKSEMEFLETRLAEFEDSYIREELVEVK